MACADCPRQSASPRSARAWCTILRNWRFWDAVCEVTKKRRERPPEEES